MFVEDGFYHFVYSGLGKINIQFLESGDPNVVFFELSAELVEIGAIIGEGESVHIVGPNV